MTSMSYSSRSLAPRDRSADRHRALRVHQARQSLCNGLAGTVDPVPHDLEAVDRLVVVRSW